MNRDAMRRFYDAATAAGEDDRRLGPRPARWTTATRSASPESAIHWQVDVSRWLDARRAALEAHRSQTTDVGMMLAMPDRGLRRTFFGTEHYIEPGRPPGMVQGWPFGG